jgi:hypothetical protein
VQAPRTWNVTQSERVDLLDRLLRQRHRAYCLFRGVGRKRVVIISFLASEVQKQDILSNLGTLRASFLLDLEVRIAAPIEGDARSNEVFAFGMEGCIVGSADGGTGGGFIIRFGRECFRQIEKIVPIKHPERARS